MSQQVQIDYRQIASQCQSVCEVAEARLKELDELLAKLKESSSSILSSRSEELERAIELEKEKLIAQIKEVREKADEDAKLGVVHTNNHDLRYAHRNDTIAAAERLQQTADTIASERLIEFQTLLTALLGENLNDIYDKMRERNRGVITIDSATQGVLDSIDDVTLRQFVYIAYLQDNTLVGDNLITAGKALMESALNTTYESRYEQEAAKIRAELEAAKVDRDTVEKVMDGASGSARERLTTVREVATQEIVGEKVRQKSIKIIMQAIQQRGFIVDKKNIKIKRDTNEVVMVALKASGEKAEFRVFLDGKFIYDFHGYEGQACQKDIEPFMHDLEEVYGVHITKQQEIWSNPDKISTMKYQAMNTNKNKK